MSQIQPSPKALELARQVLRIEADAVLVEFGRGEVQGFVRDKKSRFGEAPHAVEDIAAREVHLNQKIFIQHGDALANDIAHFDDPERRVDIGIFRAGQQAFQMGQHRFAGGGKQVDQQVSTQDHIIGRLSFKE